MAKVDAEKFLEEKFGRLTFARALRSQRMCEELSQQDLADKVGVTKQAISKFEKGVDFPSAETVKLIAAVLGMSYGFCVSLIIQDFAEKKGFGELKVNPQDVKQPRKPTRSA